MSNQTLWCTFHDSVSFTVPEGIDLTDRKHVVWWVKWGTLYIEHKDGRKWEIEPTDGPEMKWPEEMTLDDEDVETNSGFEPESESESESEEDETDSQTSDQER